jgi:phosphoenolpyruvate carboxylase
VATHHPLRPLPPQLPEGLQYEVTLLAGVLEDALAECEGQEFVDKVTWLRNAVIRQRTTGTGSIDELLVEVGELDPDVARKIAYALTAHCLLLNIAEDRQRIKTSRMKGRAGQVDAEGIVAGISEVTSLIGKNDTRRLVQRLRIHPVFTAHPTEARRRSVTRILRRVAAELKRFDEIEVDDALIQDIRRRLVEEVTNLWRTSPFRPTRPQPIDEVERVIAVLGHQVFHVVADVYREVDRALDPTTVGGREPLTGSFMRYGSWVGGDRDGNPFVTGDVTREAGRRYAEEALLRLEEHTRAVALSLTADPASGAPVTEELERSLAEDRARSPEAAATLDRVATGQPYRHKLELAADRLHATRLGDDDAYGGPDEFIAELDLVQRSLLDGGNPRLAYGVLQDLKWRAESFGFHLASLEVRQHSAVHARVLDDLRPGTAGDVDALAQLIQDGWPQGTEPSSDEAREALDTVRAMWDLQQRYGPEACYRYIISFTTTAADLLAVRALVRAALTDEEFAAFRLSVVPLFETRADLQRAPEVLEEVLAAPGERERLEAAGRELEVMIGYSDSAKDAGLLAAHVALHQLQGQLARWARDQDIKLTFFHGRGGSMGRGGGPLNRAIRGQGGGSVDGRFKVTEQGEVIFARYRSVNTGRRHLERTVNAVLATSTPHAEERAWRQEERFADVADQMAVASERRFRELIDAEGFAEYFALATPYDEIGQLAIGSRPAHRTKARDLSSLRAIPWVFAWSQSRVNLTGWYGVGTGLAAVGEQEGGLELLRAMRREWPFFQPVLEMAEMSLAKADKLLGRYALELGQHPGLTEAIMTEWELSEEWLLKVTGQESLLERQPALRAAVSLRRPDIDALSLLQLATLSRLRSQDEPDPFDQLVVKTTVAGLSAGLQNTG